MPPSRNALLLALAATTFCFLLYYFQSQRERNRLILNSSASLVDPSSSSAITSLSSSSSHVPSPLLIYNRIPKTASTTLMHLPYELYKDLGYNVLLINNSRPQHYMTLKVIMGHSAGFFPSIPLATTIFFLRTRVLLRPTSLSGAPNSPPFTTAISPTLTSLRWA